MRYVQQSYQPSIHAHCSSILSLGVAPRDDADLSLRDKSVGSTNDGAFGVADREQTSVDLSLNLHQCIGHGRAAA